MHDDVTQGHPTKRSDMRITLLVALLVYHQHYCLIQLFLINPSKQYLIVHSQLYLDINLTIRLAVF